jgi:hypothetical protein
MYAQFSEHFPGIIIDEQKAVLHFSHKRFAHEFDEYIEASSNPDWAFLLNSGIDILSVDAFSWGHVFVRYIDEVKEFLRAGKIIA